MSSDGWVEARVEVARASPYGLDRSRDRQRLAMAIGDAAAMSPDFHHAAVARLSLLLQEIVVEALQINRPQRQSDHPRQQDQQQQARAPDGKAQAQDRIGRRLHPI